MSRNVPQSIKMRQKAGTDLPFVNLVDQNGGTRVIFDSRNARLGIYTLELESYDLNGGVFSTLKSDVITIYVEQTLPT